MKTNLLFWSYLAHFFIEWEMFQIKVVEKIKTHFVFNTPLPPENRAVYEIMWKNGGGRPQVTAWFMRITRWIPRATNTHSKYVILIAFPLQQWLHERASMLRYTYSACLCRRSVTKQKERTPVSIRFSVCLWFCFSDLGVCRIFMKFRIKVVEQARVLWKSAQWYCVL